ncbi:MAG: hypothetical protein ABWZ52_01760 [Acidimicrobiales bacterium]
MPAPATHRRRHRGPGHTLLPSLARIIDQATAADPDHVMIRVTSPIDSDVELGLRSLDPGSHPFDVLAGFEAPDDWAVFGLRTTGRARRVDHPTAAPRPVATTFVVDRLGCEASVLRVDGDVVEPPGPAEGTIPDLCRRALGLPTAPAPPTTAALWAAMWLDRLIDGWGQPHRRRDVLRSWGQVAILHPAVAAPSPLDLRSITDPASLAAVARVHARATTWHDLRAATEPLPLPDGPLPVDIARWMDDGFFARWTIGAYPPIDRTARELRQLLGEPLGSQLLDALVQLLER